MAPLIGALALGGLGYLQGAQKAKAEKQQMLANAEQIRYSPWTGMKSNVMGGSGTDPFLSAAQGAVGGAMMGQQFADGAAPAAEAAPAAVEPMAEPMPAQTYETASQEGMQYSSPWFGQMGSPKKEVLYAKNK